MLDYIGAGLAIGIVLTLYGGLFISHIQEEYRIGRNTGESKKKALLTSIVGAVIEFGAILLALVIFAFIMNVLFTSSDGDPCFDPGYPVSSDC